MTRTKLGAKVLALAVCMLLILTACGNDTSGLGGTLTPKDKDSSTTASAPDTSTPSPLDKGANRGTPTGEIADVTGRRIVNFNQMEYNRPDVAAMEQLLVDRTEDIKQATSFEEMLGYDLDTADAWQEFNTMYSLANVHHYLDTADEFYEEELRYLDEVSVDLDLINDDLNRAILEGPFADDYREYYGDYVVDSMEISLLLNSEAVADYKKESGQLSIDYRSVTADMTLEWEGETYTLDEIFEADDYDLLYDMYMTYYQQNAETVAEIYARKIEVDKLTASTLGFDSPAEMYYLYYSRDYTPADAQEFCDLGKELFSDLILPLAMVSYYDPVDLGETLDSMPGALASIDTDLEKVWNALLEYDLGDFEARSEKTSGIGFTTSFPIYDAPYVYTYWEGTSSSATTVMHEFGHFYDKWLRLDDSVVGNLDIAESYSQGLEVLLYPYYDDFFADGEEAAEANLSGLVVSSLVYQLLLEEFQLRAYELEDVNAASLSALFAELKDEYGLGAFATVDENGYDYVWIDVPHLFNSPFYTVSYSTSVCVALQLWSVSLDDHDKAVDIYMDMINADQNQPFVQLVESVGLNRPNSRATLETIAKDIRDVFDI